MIFTIAAGVVLGAVALCVLVALFAFLVELPDIIAENARQFVRFARGPIWSPAGKRDAAVLAVTATVVLVWVALLP